MAMEKKGSLQPNKDVPLRESLQPNVPPREFRNSLKNLLSAATDPGLPPTKPHTMMSASKPKPAAPAPTPTASTTPKE